MGLLLSKPSVVPQASDYQTTQSLMSVAQLLWIDLVLVPLASAALIWESPRREACPKLCLLFCASVCVLVHGKHTLGTEQVVRLIRPRQQLLCACAECQLARDPASIDKWSHMMLLPFGVDKTQSMRGRCTRGVFEHAGVPLWRPADGVWH